MSREIIKRGTTSESAWTVDSAVSVPRGTEWKQDCLSPRGKGEGYIPFPVHGTKTSGVADRKKDTTSDSTHVASRAQLWDPGDRQLSNCSLGKLPKVYL